MKKVSIQLALDGHSFSVPGELPATGELLVEVLTPRTMLVPAELFAPEKAAAMLAMNGMPAAEGERVVWSNPEAEFVALMAAEGQTIDRIGSEPGIRAHYTTPLLHTPSETEQIVWVLWEAGLLYIKVYDKTLRLAEVLPTSGEADMLFFMESLGREFPIEQYELRCEGAEAKRLRKLLSGWFRRIVVENGKG